jgi:hypothetical protein
MAVNWQTDTPSATSVVKYGTVSKKYTASSSGSSSIYYRTSQHSVVLGTLQPNTTYFYVVGDNVGGYSSEFSFKSAPLTSELRKDFSFAIFGDLGTLDAVYIHIHAYVLQSLDTIQ